MGTGAQIPLFERLEYRITDDLAVDLGAAFQHLGSPDGS
jgi:hypothetical protein